MENSVGSFETDPLLLLKERIIKTDALLEKYGSLMQKYNDLEKSHLQAVENENEAKKKSAKFLEKYCKLTKKSHSLLNKIKTLEDEITIKSKELKESQEECAKLESLLQVFKTERKGHQSLKKDRDFLLSALWKVLKKLDEEPKRYNNKKMTEIFFKKFKKELTDLKLEDFRNNKGKNVARLGEKEESEFLFSPGSEVVDDDESDFIDTDVAPASVKSSSEKSGDNCVLENSIYTDSNDRQLETEHQNDMNTAEVDLSENQDLSLPDLCLGTRKNFEENVDSVPQTTNVPKDCLQIHISENNDFNLHQNREKEGSSTGVTSINFPVEEGSISGTEIRSNVQDQSECSQNYLNLKNKQESEEEQRKEELIKTPEKFRKTYSKRKFQSSSHNHEIMEKKISDTCHLANKSCSATGPGTIADLTDIFESGNIDIDVSSEAIDLDTDGTIEDNGIIPRHSLNSNETYDRLKSSGEVSYSKEENFNKKDSDLLVLTEEKSVDKPREVISDTGKTLVRESSKIVSLFDVDDNGSSTPSRVCDEELEDICVEFSSDNGNATDLTKAVNSVCQEKEQNDFFERDEISRKTENENQVNEKSSETCNSGLKEITIDCNSDQSVDGTIKNNHPNSEFTRKDDISDEEVYRVLREYKRVRLLSPIREEVPKKRRKLFPQQSEKQDKCNLSQNIKVVDNLKNLESFQEVLNNKPNGEELARNTKTDKEKQDKTPDKLIQTGDKIFIQENEMVQQSNRVNEEVIFPEIWMRKLCNTVWKKNFKKFKNLKSCGEMCNVHLSCLDFMKKLLKIINYYRIYMRNRTENSHFISRKMSQRTSNSQFCKRKMSSWQVEDLKETNAISKNESSFNYPKVGDRNFLTQVPMEYNSKDRLNNSAVNSQEMRNQKDVMGSDLSVSNQQVELGLPTRRNLELYGYAHGCNAGWEHEFDSDVALRHCHPNETVNNFEKKIEDSVEAHDITENVESTLKSNLENIPETDGTSSNPVDAKTDYLEECAEVKQTEFESGDPCSTTEKSELVLRSPRIRSPDNLVMEENNHTNAHSLVPKESHNLMEVDISGDSLPSTNGASVEKQKGYSNESINDSLIKEVPEEPTSSTLKDKLQEFSGQSESQSKRCSSELGEDLTLKKVQKEVTDNLEMNMYSEISDTTAVRKKRRLSSGNSKADRTYDNKMSVPKSVCGKSSEESHQEKQVPSNDTFSSQEIGTGDSSNILDSIMTAMTKQSEFFKTKTQRKETEVGGPNYRSASSSVQSPQPQNYISPNSVLRKETEVGGPNYRSVSCPVQPPQPQNYISPNSVLRKETEVGGPNYRSVSCPVQPPQPQNCISSSSVHRKIDNEFRMKGDNSAFLNLPYYWSENNHFGKQAVKEEKEGGSNYAANRSAMNRAEEAKMKSSVQTEIHNFLKSDINSVAEGEEKVKSCIAVLRMASENIIAQAIVSEIMTNVDEELKEFERPAPPLTQTQHRIMIILSVYSLSEEQFHRISNQILQIIHSKILPEKFFWPDDSLEMASRFYAALCKRLNNFKGIWKFCFKVLTSMRQRWCIPILAVLQVWPDIMHNANYVQNNLLVKTFVNVILHTPKAVGMRRKRQEKKVLAIKHLLINFYNFDVNSTIEGFTQKLWESLVNNTSGSVDAFVLLCKCQTWTWTRKNVIPKLLETLESWMKGEAHDGMGSEILDILRQITSIFPDANSAEASSAKDVLSVLSEVLGTERINPVSKEKIIRILCDFSHYSDTRDVLQRFLENLSTSEPLYAVIQKALSSKVSKRKASCKKENTKIIWRQRKNTKPKKKKKNSNRQKNVPDNVKA